MTYSIYPEQPEQLNSLKLKIELAKLTAVERILQKAKHELAELEKLDKESQDKNLTALIDFHECYELDISPEYLKGNNFAHPAQTTFTTERGLLKIFTNFFSTLKLLFFSSSSCKDESDQNNITDLVAKIDLDDLYYPDLYYSSVVGPLWGTVEIDREILYTRKQIYITRRLLRAKTPVGIFKRNLRTIIRMIHQFLFKQTGDDQYDFIVSIV